VVILASLSALGAAGKPATPRFKWGQTKDLLMISVMVRDLDAESVAVEAPTAGDLLFSARDARGEEYRLELLLRDDVKPESMKWEVLVRPDKWGTATLITLTKAHERKWDLLVEDPKKFKGLIDKDWTREDETLEHEDDIPYLELHEGYLKELTEKNWNKTLKKFKIVVANVRYPWCAMCKSQDEVFARAAKFAKQKAKTDSLWANLTFGVVDARESRRLARKLGAKCDSVCEYKVLEGPDSEPSTLQSRHQEFQLLLFVSKYMIPPVAPMKASELEKSYQNITCAGRFDSDTSPRYRLFEKVAKRLRLEGGIMFLAAFGEEGPTTFTAPNQDSTETYHGTWDDDGTEFLNWVRPRTMPVLQTYDFDKRETYESLGLPVAKVWIDDKGASDAFNKIVRHAVRRVGKKFVGRIAFVEVPKSTYSYELVNFGLNQPEVYPAFGIVSNVSYNSDKWAFEVAADPYVSELFEGATPSTEAFWKEPDKVVEVLSRFCERVLSGAHPQAHETGRPQANWSVGQVKRLVWKTYSEVKNPDKPLLLEMYGKYRSESEKKAKEAENLATVLEPHSDAFVVASYETSENYLPPGDFKREKYASVTEWYWVPRQDVGSGKFVVKKLKKPKADAPIKTVLEFLKKQSGADLDISSLTAKFEELMISNGPPPPPSRVIDPELEDDEPEGQEQPAEQAGSERGADGLERVAPGESMLGDGKGSEL